MQKNEDDATTMKKIIKVIIFVVVVGVLLAVAYFALLLPSRMETTKTPAEAPSETPAETPADMKTLASSIKISDDGKSVIDNDTAKVIFTIEEAQKYLKANGYEYDPDTFQTTNAKYLGDCFSEADLSHNKQEIIFSSSCLPGDLPEAWIGVYAISAAACSADKCAIDGAQASFRFVTGGGGNNFVWSADDKSVSYDAILGLSGWSLGETIDMETGKVIVTEDCEKFAQKQIGSKDECYKLVASESKDESVCAKIGLPETRSVCYMDVAEIKNDFSICQNNGLTAAIASDCAEYFGKINKN